MVENETLISKEELLEKGQKSIDELRKRDEDMRVKYGERDNVVFVERNNRDRLLFYPMNHPTKHNIGRAGSPSGSSLILRRLR